MIEIVKSMRFKKIHTYGRNLKLLQPYFYGFEWFQGNDEQVHVSKQSLEKQKLKS